MKNMLYPKIRKELLRLVDIEQDEIRSLFGEKTRNMNLEKEFKELMIRCQKRSERVIDILELIKEPTASNIGDDGSEAVLTLTMHSYLKLMKDVLKIYEDIFELNPTDIHYQSIPALKDRVMVLESRKQLFGTQWMTDDNDSPFLIEIEDYQNVTERRRKYGLGPIKNPKNLAKGAKLYPIGQGTADLKLMKPMSTKDYNQYSKYYLKKISNE